MNFSAVINAIVEHTGFLFSKYFFCFCIKLKIKDMQMISIYFGYVHMYINVVFLSCL